MGAWNLRADPRTVRAPAQEAHWRPVAFAIHPRSGGGCCKGHQARKSREESAGFPPQTLPRPEAGGPRSGFGRFLRGGGGLQSTPTPHLPPPSAPGLGASARGLRGLRPREGGGLLAADRAPVRQGVHRLRQDAGLHQRPRQGRHLLRGLLLPAHHHHHPQEEGAHRQRASAAETAVTDSRPPPQPCRGTSPTTIGPSPSSPPRAGSTKSVRPARRAPRARPAPPAPRPARAPRARAEGGVPSRRGAGPSARG